MEKLVLLDCLDIHLLIECLIGCRVDVARQILEALVHVLGVLLIKVLLGPALPIVSCRNQEGNVKFDISEGVKNFHEPLSSDFFIDVLLSLLELPLLVAHLGGARPAAVVGVDAYPLGLVLGLDHFKSVQS